MLEGASDGAPGKIPFENPLEGVLNRFDRPNVLGPKAEPVCPGAELNKGDD